MKKVMLLIVGASLLLSSCGTYEASGAYVGSGIGAILGSAIGGIAGGGRGSDLGTIVGMASGAALGAAIGSAADQQAREREAQDVHDHYMRVQRNKAMGINPYKSTSNSSMYYERSNKDSSMPDMGNTVPETIIVDETNSANDRIVFEK